MAEDPSTEHPRHAARDAEPGDADPRDLTAEAREPGTPAVARGSGPRAAPLGRLRAVRQAVDWRHGLREVAVIALGALAALGAQAWWQDRQDRERERDYLRHLLADTRENARRLDVAIADDSASERAQARLADALYGAGPLPPADTLVRLFTGGDRNALSASDFQPVAGTYAALLSTGDLRLIRDERTRTRLVAYAARLDSERGILQALWQQAFGDVSRVPRALPFMRRLFGQREAARDEARHFPFARLRGDPDMAALLFTLQASTVNRLSHLHGLRNDTRQLLRALEGRPDADASAFAKPR